MGQRSMLTMTDGEEISRGLPEDLQQQAIAARIGRKPSVVCREIARHGGTSGYRAVRAGAQAAARRARPKSPKLDSCVGLREVVTSKEEWSRVVDGAS